MKNIIFNQNSWHYYLANRIGNYHPYYRPYGYGDSTDICTYSRFVLWGIIKLFMFGIMFAVVSHIMIHIMFGIWFSFMLHTFFFSETAIVGLMFLGIIFVILLFCWYDELIAHRRYDKPDNFLTQTYKSWKEKFCVKIEFKDK